MTLGDFWFIVAAIFWVGFFVLEGFDFGVGMLHAILGRNDLERRVLINAIGPVWDGNEVWLIVAGAVLFSAFPGWYATMFSALYLGLVLLLVALIVRGLSFEWQRKFDDPRWRTFWRVGLTVTSALIPFLLGLALGDLLHGLPINSDHVYTGGFWHLFTPFGVWSGITLVVLSLLSGTTFLTLKTTGELHERAQRAATVVGVVAVVVTFGFMTWVHVGLSTGFVPEPLEALALLAVIVAAWAARERADGWAFMAACVGIGGTVGSLFNRALPTGDDLEHQPRVQPDGQQHGEPAVHVEGDDRDRRDLSADRGRRTRPGRTRSSAGGSRYRRRTATMTVLLRRCRGRRRTPAGRSSLAGTPQTADRELL